MAAPASEAPEEAFREFRATSWQTFVKDLLGMGSLPLAAILFVPRTSISYLIVSFAMLARCVARLFFATGTYEQKANLRILIVTDYMPPQTHGIAIRFRQYIDYMRKEGHEVHVFTTNFVREKESSFDHPNLPSIVNPYNTSNKMAYSAGVKLAWYLGAKTWDVVHIVAPSNIIWPVTTICAWRRIPIYVSHHVEMKYYVYEYIKKVRFLAHVGWFLYKLFQLWPATYLAQLNAAPTLCFLNDHLPNVKGQLRRRIPSGVAHERFLVDSPEQVHGERRALLTKCGLAADADVCLFLMVQRLAPEKGTIRCLEALATVARTPGKPLSLDGKRPVHVVIAGDGPSRGLLEKFARDKDLPVTFTGNLPNTQLPPLYRAADVFVTCSTSETFGLTVLEALACGTPAVLPHCSVFDELWVGRVPDEWIYDEGDTGSITAALRSASAPAGKKRLQTHPIKASWQDCTQELLGQYREMIAHNLNHRQALATVIRALDHFLRAVFLSLGAWWCMRAYTTKLLKVGMHIFDDLMDL